MSIIESRYYHLFKHARVKKVEHVELHAGSKDLHSVVIMLRTSRIIQLESKIVCCKFCFYWSSAISWTKNTASHGTFDKVNRKEVKPLRILGELLHMEEDTDWKIVCPQFCFISAVSNIKD